MTLLTLEQDQMKRFVGAKIPWAAGFGDQSVAIGNFTDTGSGGAVVMHDYNGHSCELSWAGQGNWATRGFLKRVFTYVFNDAGCQRCMVIVRKRDKRTRKLAERLGFKHEGTHPEGLPGEIMCTYGMLKSQCKWIDTDGQEHHTENAAAA